MRTIILKYAGECRKCSATLEAGAPAGYERHVGVFCPTCTPTDTEEIRTYRQEGADRKAERLHGWAEKRFQSAGAVLASHEIYRGDTAFNTQPGHIPLRARIIAREDRACESLSIARAMEAKAHSLESGVVVKGDADRARQAQRDAMRPLLAVGMRVHSILWGDGVVEKVNKNTVRILGSVRNTSVLEDLAWIRIIG
jgi:hypothetical protein